MPDPFDPSPMLFEKPYHAVQMMLLSLTLTKPGVYYPVYYKSEVLSPWNGKRNFSPSIGKRLPSTGFIDPPCWMPASNLHFGMQKIALTQELYDKLTSNFRKFEVNLAKLGIAWSYYLSSWQSGYIRVAYLNFASAYECLYQDENEKQAYNGKLLKRARRYLGFEKTEGQRNLFWNIEQVRHKYAHGSKVEPDILPISLKEHDALSKRLVCVHDCLHILDGMRAQCDKGKTVRIENYYILQLIGLVQETVKKKLLAMY